MDGIKFFEAVSAGETTATELLNIYTKNLARQLLNLQVILDPEVISIGGGVSASKFCLTLLKEILKNYMRKFLIRCLK